MDDKDKQLLSEYARLKSEEGAIKERLAEIQPEVLELIFGIDEYDTKVETSLGNFTVRKVKTWTYPAAIVEAEDNVKTAKKQAQANGDATFEVEPGLNFRRKTV